MRFFCEWCFERVDIVLEHSPYAEVLRHFTGCPRRPPTATDEKVTGLASHITGVIAHREDARARKAG